MRRTVIAREPLICDFCEKSFKQKALLRSHLTSHMTEPQFFCTLCPYASKRNNDLKKHQDTHHNPDRVTTKRTRRRKCTKCEEFLENKKALRLHMREKHRPEKPEKKIKSTKKTCGKCEEVLDGMKEFKQHMTEKHPMQPIRCETCHRKFKTNFRLKKHQIKYGKL
jgi:hypothetical protein